MPKNTGVEPGRRVRESASFFGRITREEAELFLQNSRCQEGSYLLREGITPVGNYVLSIVHHSNVHHYSIEKQVDGTYQIPEGKNFKDPIDLIEHHRKYLDGFLTHPLYPCNRPKGMSPLKYRGVTYSDLDVKLLKKAESMRLKGKELEKALSKNRDPLVSLVTKDLYKEQPWYHGCIEREEADRRIQKDLHENGKFLIREKDKRRGQNCYALSISYMNEAKHYIIEKEKSDHYSINEGPKFDNLMLLVDHYYNKQDGLICKLKMPCCNANFDKQKLHAFTNNIFINTENPAYPALPPARCQTFASISAGSEVLNQSARRSSGSSQGGRGMSPGRRKLPQTPTSSTRGRDDPLPQPPVMDDTGTMEEWEAPADEMSAAAAALANTKVFGERDPEEIYGQVQRNEATFILRREQITLEDDTLGTGNFGSVKRGRCRTKDGDIPVAVKTLKQDDLSDSGQEPEIVKEARVMQQLDNRNIVRLIGICQAENFMLVMELAPHGPLNKFVQKNRDIPLWNLIELMYQVAMGMAYLESKRFVHRDLAARNVLLVTPHFAKVSDFGMSKALGVHSEYYKACNVGKWPLKWYAPECMYYFKFDSKSDVWSFGVTLWEALSYGEKPYKKMRGEQLLTFLYKGNRLSKPDISDKKTHDVMLQCWAWEKEERPSFGELVPIMQDAYERNKYGSASGISV